MASEKRTISLTDKDMRRLDLIVAEHGCENISQFLRSIVTRKIEIVTKPKEYSRKRNMIDLVEECSSILNEIMQNISDE